MKVFYVVQGKHLYELRGQGRRWLFERWSGVRFNRRDWAHTLDHDARHRRLFLTDQVERKMAVESLVILERLARKALGRVPTKRRSS